MTVKKDVKKKVCKKFQELNAKNKVLYLERLGLIFTAKKEQTKH